MVNQDLSKEELKIFTGYSGWSPYQLDQEVQNKMWTVVDHFFNWITPHPMIIPFGKNHAKSRRRLFALGQFSRRCEFELG